MPITKYRYRFCTTVIEPISVDGETHDQIFINQIPMAKRSLVFGYADTWEAARLALADHWDLRAREALANAAIAEFRLAEVRAMTPPEAT